MTAGTEFEVTLVSNQSAYKWQKRGLYWSHEGRHKEEILKRGLPVHRDKEKPYRFVKKKTKGG